MHPPPPNKKNVTRREGMPLLSDAFVFKSLWSLLSYITVQFSVPVMSVTLTPTPIFAIAGKQINITCTTPYCYPPADITWYINFENMPSKDIYRYTYKGGLVRTISTLSTTFNKSDNGNEMYCTARNLPYQGVNSTVYTVTVMCMYSLSLYCSTTMYNKEYT